MGSGLTAKAIAIALSDLNVSIDLIQEKSFPVQSKSNVTLSISDASLKILEKIGVKKKKSLFWPIKKIALFDSGENQSLPDTEFCNFNYKKDLSHIVKKIILEKELSKKLKKIKVIKNKIISIESNNFLKKIIFQNKKQKEYNLIIATEFGNLRLLSNEKNIIGTTPKLPILF